MFSYFLKFLVTLSTVKMMYTGLSTKIAAPSFSCSPVGPPVPGFSRPPDPNPGHSFTSHRPRRRDDLHPPLIFCTSGVGARSHARPPSCHCHDASQVRTPGRQGSRTLGLPIGSAGESGSGASPRRRHRSDGAHEPTHCRHARHKPLHGHRQPVMIQDFLIQSMATNNGLPFSIVCLLYTDCFLSRGSCGKG